MTLCLENPKNAINNERKIFLKMILEVSVSKSTSQPY